MVRKNVRHSRSGKISPLRQAAGLSLGSKPHPVKAIRNQANCPVNSKPLSLEIANTEGAAAFNAAEIERRELPGLQARTLQASGIFIVSGWRNAPRRQTSVSEITFAVSVCIPAAYFVHL